MLSLKGGPAFKITPEKMYSKQDTRKRAVFSELLISDSSWPMTGGIYHGCSRTVMYAIPWMAMPIIISPSSGVNTFRDTSPDIGRFVWSTWAGPAHPMKIAIGRMSSKSINKN